MFKHKLQQLAAIAMMATLAACDATPLAPRAESRIAVAGVTAAASSNVISRDEATVPFTFVQYTPCANGGQGEVLQASGTLQYRGHWITTSKGTRQHNVIVASFTGTATGWDTGEVYDVVTKELSQSNTAYGTDGIQDSGEELQRIRLRLTSRVTGAVYTIDLVGRFVQAANGEFVLSGWEGTARCG